MLELWTPSRREHASLRLRKDENARLTRPYGFAANRTSTARLTGCSAILSRTMTTQYIAELTTAYPSIREVWLFGSRANGTERPDSDWDYLVFGDDDRLLGFLHMDTRFNVPYIDLMIVCWPHAAKPWIDDRQKLLNLNDDPGNMAWHVEPRTATETTYIQTKEREPPSFEVDVRRVKALLVYRRPQ
jgi:hypothetical protein